MLVDTIKDDLKTLIKEANKDGVLALRLLLSAIHNAEIEKGRPLSDDQVREVILKEVKKRKESIEAFKLAQRFDLVSKEENELTVLQKYLPPQLDKTAVEAIVERVLEEIGPVGSNAQQVMARVMPQLKGRADGALVWEIVKKKLAK